jgi:hypothetical protein
MREDFVIFQLFSMASIFALVAIQVVFHSKLLLQFLVEGFQLRAD